MFVSTSRPLDTADADIAEDDGWRVAVDTSTDRAGNVRRVTKGFAIVRRR